MPIRLSGLSSGLDTDSIIQELVKAKSAKKETYVKKQKKLSWTQDSWKSLNTKIYSLYSSTLSNMRLSSDYIKKTTTSSNNAVSVITGDSAANCYQTMNIINISKAGYLTGAKLGENTTYTTDTKLVGDIGLTNGSSFDVTVADTTTSITIKEDMTISDLVSELKNAGINANFDENNQRFYISSKKNGKDNDFKITTETVASLKDLGKLGLATPLSADSNTADLYHSYADKIAYYDGAVDRDTTASNLQSFIDELVAERLTKYKQIYTLATATKQNKQEEYNSLYEEYNNTFTGENYLNVDGVPVTDSETIQNRINEINEDETLNEEEKSVKVSFLQEQLLKAKKLEEVNGDIQTQDSIIANSLLYYDAENDTATTTLTDQVKNEVVDKAVNYQSVLDYYAANSSSFSGAVRIVGTNASITLNNVGYESENNTFEINGLTITLNNMTTDEISLNTMDDTNGIYDMIKNFITKYDELINEMDKLYNSASASKYDMLSDDDKESMSDDEAKEWEDKIKASLLRRDSTLGTVSNAMKEIMLQGVKKADGSKMYLSDFGINTLGYFDSADNEKSAYHIDGNPDDANTAKNTDKLKAAIASDSDSVTYFFSNLVRNLYGKLDDLMESTDYSSAFKVYNDKEMQSQYEDYTDKISSQEDLINDYEDKYYKKFAAMEAAMSKLNSQQSTLSSLFGN